MLLETNDVINATSKNGTFPTDVSILRTADKLQFASHASVIILLSILIALTCVFLLCGLLKKAEAHAGQVSGRSLGGHGSMIGDAEF